MTHFPMTLSERVRALLSAQTRTSDICPACGRALGASDTMRVGSVRVHVACYERERGGKT